MSLVAHGSEQDRVQLADAGTGEVQAMVHLNKGQTVHLTQVAHHADDVSFSGFLMHMDPPA
jgi:hypothetical protein